ncbi:MAG: manganese efflux pump MntP family protein [Candidatus Kapaibacterium sp.]
MTFSEILLIAFALGIDAFAVSLAAGSFFGKASGRQKFRLSFHFGLFQFMMPIIGWLAGSGIEQYIHKFDHWVAFALLAAIGGKMIWDGFRGEGGEVSHDISRGVSLVSLSVATSIDALAVGFSIGVIKSGILWPSIIIGVTASAMSLVGIYLGERLSARFGGGISVFGGLVLLLIGLNILRDHLNFF